jgi:prefoldin subunit 5
VKPGSIAEKVGLRIKDSLVKIGNDCALDYTIDEAMESLKRGKDFFDMIVER